MKIEKAITKDPTPALALTLETVVNNSYHIYALVAQSELQHWAN